MIRPLILLMLLAGTAHAQSYSYDDPLERVAAAVRPRQASTLPYYNEYSTKLWWDRWQTWYVNASLHAARKAQFDRQYAIQAASGGRVALRLHRRQLKRARLQAVGISGIWHP